MRTCVREPYGRRPRRRADPACRPRPVLRIGRAAHGPRLRGRPVIGRRRRRARRQLRGQGLGVRTPMGGGQARALCPQAVVVAPRFPAYVEASKAVFAVFDDTTPLVEGLRRSTRRSSTCRAWGGCVGHASPDRRPPAPPGPRRGRPRPSPSAWPAPSSWPRWPAPWPSPTACWSCRPTASCTSCTLPVERLWGVGQGHAAARAGAHHGRRGGPSARGRAGRHARPARRAPPARWRTTATPGRSRSSRRRRSIGSQRARAVASQPHPLRAWPEATVIALVDRVTRRMRDAGRVGRTVTLRSCASTTSPGHPVAHARPGHRLDPRRAGGRLRPAGGSDAAHPATG